MIIHISHGADQGDWFVVKPLPGQRETSAAGTPITHEMAVASLLRAGRTVYELNVVPFAARDVPRETAVQGGDSYLTEQSDDELRRGMRDVHPLISPGEDPRRDMLIRLGMPAEDTDAAIAAAEAQAAHEDQTRPQWAVAPDKGAVHARLRGERLYASACDRVRQAYGLETARLLGPVLWNALVAREMLGLIAAQDGSVPAEAIRAMVNGAWDQLTEAENTDVR